MAVNCIQLDQRLYGYEFADTFNINYWPHALPHIESG